MNKEINRNHKSSPWIVAGLSALTIFAATVPAHSQGRSGNVYGRGERRLEGERLTTMRALAHRLDDAAEVAARSAGDTAVERNGRFRQQFLWAIRDFSRQARSLHERLDQYGVSPWDVADEVTLLNQRAQTVTAQLRTAKAFPDTYADWSEAQKSLTLMNAVLRGQRVIIPSVERPGYQPFDERYQYRNGRHWPEPGDVSRDGYLAGKDMIEFRRLAEQLTVEIGRLSGSVRQGANIPDRVARPLSELRYFAQRAEDVNRLASADVLNGRDVAFTIEEMRRDARQYEGNMRASNDFPNADWSRVMQVLDQMAAIVRAQ